MDSPNRFQRYSLFKGWWVLNFYLLDHNRFGVVGKCFYYTSPHYEYKYWHIHKSQHSEAIIEGEDIFHAKLLFRSVAKLNQKDKVTHRFIIIFDLRLRVSVCIAFLVLGLNIVVGVSGTHVSWLPARRTECEQYDKEECWNNFHGWDIFHTTNIRQ